MGGRGSRSGIRSGSGGLPVIRGRRSPAGFLGGGGAGGGSPPGYSSSAADDERLLRDRNGAQGGSTPGAPAGSHTRPPISLEGFDAYQRDWESRYFGMLSTEDKRYLQEQFQRVFENNGFYMNIQSRFLENVADEHFKNQFETGGRSGGAEFDASDLTPTNGRIEAAINMFGLDYTKMKAEDYEKYGSMQTLDLLTAAERSPAGYGDALVRFRREAVIDRTTYTLGDSLAAAECNDLVAGKVSEFQYTGIPVYEIPGMVDRAKAAEQYVTDAQMWDKVMEGVWSTYLEVQYHGRLTMSDVESIVFTQAYNIPDAGVLGKLRSFGVKLYKYEGGRLIAL